MSELHFCRLIFAQSVEIFLEFGYFSKYFSNIFVFLSEKKSKHKCQRSMRTMRINTPDANYLTSINYSQHIDM